jgi:hypothetical protein
LIGFISELNRFKNSLKEVGRFVKKYLNLFKYGRSGYAAAVRSDLAWRIIAESLIEP